MKTELWSMGLENEVKDIWNLSDRHVQNVHLSVIPHTTYNGPTCIATA